MGVELQNNFVDGFYCWDNNSNSKCQTNESGNGYSTLISKNKIVKQCLKTKVIGSLKSRGLDHVAADFSPKPNYPMTKEEIEKDRRRRQSNRDSARKCREKQKAEDKKNMKLLSQLKMQKEKLLEAVSKSEDEKNRLLYNLKSVLPDSYITEALRKVENVTAEKDRLLADQSSNCAVIVPIDSPNFSESFVWEESRSSESFVLAPFDNFTGEGGIMDGSVEYLEVTNEETVPLIDINDENSTVYTIKYEDPGISHTLL